MPEISVENTANYKPAFDRKILFPIILLKAFTSSSPQFKSRGYHPIETHFPEHSHWEEQCHKPSLHPSLVTGESK